MDTVLTTFLIAVPTLLIGSALYSLIFLNNRQREEIRARRVRAKQERAIARDAEGVHWTWWVFWLIVCFPALIIVAIVHNGRKTRAAIRELKQ